MIDNAIQEIDGYITKLSNYGMQSRNLRYGELLPVFLNEQPHVTFSGIKLFYELALNTKLTETSDTAKKQIIDAFGLAEEKVPGLIMSNRNEIHFLQLKLKEFYAERFVPGTPQEAHEALLRVIESDREKKLDFLAFLQLCHFAYHLKYPADEACSNAIRRIAGGLWSDYQRAFSGVATAPFIKLAFDWLIKISQCCS